MCLAASSTPSTERLLLVYGARSTPAASIPASQARTSSTRSSGLETACGVWVRVQSEMIVMRATNRPSPSTEARMTTVLVRRAGHCLGMRRSWTRGHHRRVDDVTRGCMSSSIALVGARLSSRRSMRR